ncbi:hypothetical protein CVT24_010195 [Panaeolus cyanescens]|uniref:Ras GEF n=1 Tax=Panaeolus cyanescens TaxID=181874 RepID=A0A409YPW8_9AGAR|nr:hypothetical protein CVT24_010195 [Panaeolus cyanescens]
MSEAHDHSRPETPLASAQQIPSIETPDPSSILDSIEGPSLASTLKLPNSDDTSTNYLSPIAPDKPPHTPHPFSLSDLLKEGETLEALGPEVAAADVTVAADGNYIESSSGPAIRELKRRYDQQAGVGPSVRTPYVITSFVNQHGKSTYRLGRREEHSAPAANIDPIAPPKPSDPSQSPRPKRRSRLSMHFLQPAMFTKSNAPPPSRPPTATSTAASTVSRKLRKTRSIPDLTSTGDPSATGATPSPTYAVTGRGHSQSVTAADAPRYSGSLPIFNPPPSRRTDAFAELMDWFTPSSTISTKFTTPSQSSNKSHDSKRERAIVEQPFGPRVTFTSPSPRIFIPPHLTAPRHLREMQSFESGLTARQVDSKPTNNSSPAPSEPSDSDRELSRPPSAIRLSVASTSLLSSSSSEDSDGDLLEEPEVPNETDGEGFRLSSLYSTEVFNVLQTYRGLPLFENLVPEGSTVIRLSLANDQSAAPRDDPRFVIWGESLDLEGDDEYRSASRDSLADFSSSNPSSSLSSRKSSRMSRLRSPDPSLSSSRLPTPGGQRVLLAATIERWIAQLTSEMNYDELLNFFLTYRTYVSAVDLCHLLICRFHWALQQPAKPSVQDETVRRIVRVRTFVAIRYWMLTFFTVDFVPNRELRLLISDWLNTLKSDPILGRHVDGLGIVRRLIKVAKECKKAHTKVAEKPKAASPPKAATSTSGTPLDHLLGKSFAEAIRKPVTDDDESDLDLDFLPDEAKADDSGAIFQNDPVNAHLAVGHPMAIATNRPTSLPISSLNILHRTEHAPPPNSDADSTPGSIRSSTSSQSGSYVYHHNPALPDPDVRPSALSRAFVRTIGRLGRWKRALAPKTYPSPYGAHMPTTREVRQGSITGPAPAPGVSAFDLGINNGAKDFLATNGHLKLSETTGNVFGGSVKANSQGLYNVGPSSAGGSAAGSSSSVGSHPIAPILTSSTSATSLTATHPPIPPMPTTPPPVPYSNGSTLSSPISSPSSPLAPYSASIHDLPPLTHPPPPPLSQSSSTDSTPSEAPLLDTPSSPETVPEVVVLQETPEVAGPPEAEPEASVTPHPDRASIIEGDTLLKPERAESFMSFRTTSSDSFGVPLTQDGPIQPTFGNAQSQWAFDVVSLDDLDLSDAASFMSKEPAHPPGLRKPMRKLPMRRDFEFVRRSEVSSMGIVSHESLTLRDSISSSNHSGSATSSGGGGGPRPIQRWQMKSLQQTFEEMSNDEDDKGDVEAALRRLEGQINPKIQQENAEKVDGWVKTLQERMAKGDYEYESSINSDYEVEDFFDEVNGVAGMESVDVQPQIDAGVSAMHAGDECDDEESHLGEDASESAITPMPTQTTHDISENQHHSQETSPHSKDSRPLPQDVVPLEILQSRLSASASTLLSNNPAASAVLLAQFADEVPRLQRSFVLNYQAETLAEHFAMIDRELFMCVKFEELVTDDWMEIEEINVLDWAQYLKDRARWKAESRFAEKTTALAAIRARFNLMVAFVVSEIVMTPPMERMFLITKFIKIAWKSYTIMNFHTLTAIIYALDNEWVNRAMQKSVWKLGAVEERMLRALKQVTSSLDDFKFIREVVEAIVDSKPLDNSSHPPSVVSGGTEGSQSGKGKAASDNRSVPSACIPFIGVYLCQLRRLSKLPALIDPTAPESVIGIDPVTAIFDSPAHPEVFSALAPLPPSMHLEPLINVHKQRRIADVIKSLVAGQHLASRVQFDIDKKLFQRCLRIRGLEASDLHRILLQTN